MESAETCIAYVLRRARFPDDKHRTCRKACEFAVPVTLSSSLDLWTSVSFKSATLTLNQPRRRQPVRRQPRIEEKLPLGNISLTHGILNIIPLIRQSSSKTLLELE